jgi:hypothetical protein
MTNLEVPLSEAIDEYLEHQREMENLLDEYPVNNDPLEKMRLVNEW